MYVCIYLSIYLSIYVPSLKGISRIYAYSIFDTSEIILIYTYLPTPPLGQDMTLGQFSSEV